PRPRAPGVARSDPSRYPRYLCQCWSPSPLTLIASGCWCSSTRRQGKAFDFGDGVVGGVDLGELANVFAHVGVLEQEIGRVLDRLRLWGRGPQVDAESVVLDAGGVGGLVFSLAGEDGPHPGRECL